MERVSGSFAKLSIDEVMAGVNAARDAILAERKIRVRRLINTEIEIQHHWANCWVGRLFRVKPIDAAEAERRVRERDRGIIFGDVQTAELYGSERMRRLDELNALCAAAAGRTNHIYVSAKDAALLWG